MQYIILQCYANVVWEVSIEYQNMHRKQKNFQSNCYSEWKFSFICFSCYEVTSCVDLSFVKHLKHEYKTLNYNNHDRNGNKDYNVTWELRNVCCFQENSLLLSTNFQRNMKTCFIIEQSFKNNCPQLQVARSKNFNCC